MLSDDTPLFSSRQIRDAAIKASYRGILGREPEPAAQAVLTATPLPSEIEKELEDIARRTIECEEFRAKTNHDDFPPDTWVMSSIDEGLFLWLDLHDRGVSRPCLQKSYEHNETKFLRSVTKPGMTFVDIGANIGWFSIHAAHWVGASGKVIAFEPRNTTFKMLKRSAEANGVSDRVDLHNLALLGEPGVTFIGYDESSGNPGGTWTLPDEKFVQDFTNLGLSVQEVKASTLDEILGDKRIDIVKIDIEGAEHLALSGGARSLERSRPVVLSEVSFEGLHLISKSSPEKYVLWMKQFGYGCYILEEGELGRPFDGVVPPDGRTLLNVVFMPE